MCGERRNEIGSVEARLAESTAVHPVNRKQATKETQRVVELQGIEFETFSSLLDMGHTHGSRLQTKA